MNKNMRKLAGFAASAVLAAGAVACGDDEETAAGASGDGGDARELSGEIRIDGSSTVFPFAQAAAELFNSEVAPEVRISVGQSGTGGGFEAFCAGETDISDASRPIDAEEEVPICEKNKVEYAEVQVANDGIAIVTNPALEVDCMTTDQLKQLWNKGSEVQTLSDIDPSFPGQELTLFGAGTDSGTFDFFTDEINGVEGVTRDDYEGSEDDNQLVQGVSGADGGLGYFGFSYYETNQESLGVVAVDAGDGCVEPSLQTIQDGSYKPLSRPLFMYPSSEALRRPAVEAFMEFIVSSHQEIAELANIVPMTEEQAAESSDEVGSL